MVAVIRSKMTSKTSLQQLLAAAALCYWVNAFSASRGAPTTHHRPPQTRLFQGTVSGRNIAASFPIISPEELEADMLININNNSASKTISSRQEEHAITATTKEATTEELVPSTWSQALHHFFLKDIGPPLVVLTISGFILTRCQLISTTPFSITELVIFASSILIWWIQEYFFHRVLLHSPFDWIGKSIHGAHHDKEYFHISIDPPALLLGWLFAAHFIIKAMLPQYHLCLTATIGYSLAGLVYEWSHYIVHTKVKPRIIPSISPSYQQLSILERRIIQPIMKGYAKMRDNHIRHHLIDDRYWYAFSVTEMDDLFGTNPNVKDVKREIRKSRDGFQ
eukprot:scaffold5704_cov144-Skeletonema_marinoi.AAC.1